MQGLLKYSYHMRAQPTLINIIRMPSDLHEIFCLKVEIRRIQIKKEEEKDFASTVSSFHLPCIEKQAKLGILCMALHRIIPAVAVSTAGATTGAVFVRYKLGRPWLEDEEGMAGAGSREKPVMHVPEDLHRQLVNQHCLVPSELPLQVGDMNEHKAIDADPHLGLVWARYRVLHHDVMLLLPLVELGPRRETLLPEHILPLRHHRRVHQGWPRLGPLVRLLLPVPQ